MTSVIAVDADHLRPLDVRRDLLEVADLIELCFINNMDADGRDYVRYIRRVAENRGLIRWVPGAAERVSLPLHGYVWEEEGKIIGNLTLIPFYYRGRWLYLIANVGVHPDFRGRGIGRLLTVRALEHIREHRVDQAWLQVRDDNPVAINLYRSLGFMERVRRTAWQGNSTLLNGEDLPDSAIAIVSRQARDWNLQSRWLEQTYPPEVSWNLSFDWRRLRPGLARALTAWINGEHFQHWTAWRRGQIVGGATWESGRALSDNLWMTSLPEGEDETVYALLAHIRNRRVTNRYLSVNYPAGRARQGFERAGFVEINTLIWMNIDFAKMR
jgi:GNAT superfamily N-acetyltransferase